MSVTNLSNREFQQFRDMIYEIAGIAMGEAKRQLIAGRLSKRLRHYELNSFGDYFQLLLKDQAELQTAIGLVAVGVGVTLVPASVQQQHRPDIEYVGLLDSGAVSPIILSRRKGDVSPIVQRCLALIEQQAL